MRKRVCSAVALASIVLAFAPGAASAQTVAPTVGETPAPAAATFHVEVLGAVKPSNYVLGDGARLSDALTAAGLSDVNAANARVGIAADEPGCFSGGADLHRVFLTRAAETSRWTSYMIDFALARQRRDLRYDPLLRANDKIFVPECRPSRIQILTPPTFPRASI